MTNDTTYPDYPFIINYFRLRPGMAYSLASFVVLLTLVLTVSWSNRIDTSDFADLTRFEMVELKIPEAAETEPDIALPDEIEEEEKLEFGDDSGKYDLSAMAATPPALKSMIPPYPESMKQAGVQGVVVLEVGIDEKGNVVYGKIQKPLHPVLDRVVIIWAQTAQFYPAYDPAGRAFKCKIFLPIRFQLK